MVGNNIAGPASNFDWSQLVLLGRVMPCRSIGPLMGWRKLDFTFFIICSMHGVWKRYHGQDRPKTYNASILLSRWSVSVSPRSRASILIIHCSIDQTTCLPSRGSPRYHIRPMPFHCRFPNANPKIYAAGPVYPYKQKPNLTPKITSPTLST